jgi:hypothetical protein
MLLGGGSNCQSCGCAPAVSGCTIKTVGGYDTYLGQKITEEPKNMLAARIGPFDSSFAITAVTILTNGLRYALQSPPLPYTVPTLELWAHNATNNLPNTLAAGAPDVLATFTEPASFAAGEWVFTNAGYTVSSGTYYWIVLRYNGEWAYWEENCDTHATFPSSGACVAACCDYWTFGSLGLFGGESASWFSVEYCGGYVLSIN